MSTEWMPDATDGTGDTGYGCWQCGGSRLLDLTPESSTVTVKIEGRRARHSTTKKVEGLNMEGTTDPKKGQEWDTRWDKMGLMVAEKGGNGKAHTST